MTSSKFKLRNCQFFWVSTFMRYYSTKQPYLHKFSVPKGSSFCDRRRLIKFPTLCVTRHLAGGRESSYVSVTDFLRFCYLNIPYLRINITLIFMSSSSDTLTQSRKTQKQMFLLVSGGHICAPQRDINIASPYKALSIWVKRFSEYLAYELRHRPDSWRGFLYIYLLSFPRSGLSVLTGLHFYFWWRDNENTELARK